MAIANDISEKLREVIPLLEVAKMLDVSRPTLYKYMEYYDNGDFDRIPGHVRDYFDYMSDGDHSRAEAKAFFNEVSDANSNDSRNCNERRGFNRSSHRRSSVDEGWSEGPLSNICVSGNGAAMVVFRDSMDGVCNTRLLVFIEVDGEEVPIGTYLPEPGMKFVRVDNLIPALDYMYRLEQECHGGRVVSPARMLKLE